MGLRGRTAANIVFATGYAIVFGGRSSRRELPWKTSRALTIDSQGIATTLNTDESDAVRFPNPTITGICWGTALITVVIAGYGVLLAVPPTRSRLAEFAAREPDVSLAEWVTIHIPLGTIYTEELIFRTTLDPLLKQSFGRSGTWLSAASFGLWHIAPARTASDSVPGTVAATALGGLILSRLRHRTDSTLTPALLHLALNTGGAIAPYLAEHLPTQHRPC